MDWNQVNDETDRIVETLGVADRIQAFRRHIDALQVGEDGRAEFLSSLAGELELIDDVGEARAAIMAAIEDGGPTLLDPRCALLSIELTAGNEESVAELLQGFLQQVRAGFLSTTECEWIGESLEAAERFREAHRWFTIPLRDIDPNDIDDLPRGLLHGRWRVRRELDLPHDAYDDARDLIMQLRAVDSAHG